MGSAGLRVSALQVPTAGSTRGLQTSTTRNMERDLSTTEPL